MLGIGMWLHPYTVILAKVIQIWVILTVMLCKMMAWQHG
jgi:hypothetical protein